MPRRARQRRVCRAAPPHTRRGGRNYALPARAAGRGMPARGASRRAGSHKGRLAAMGAHSILPVQKRATGAPLDDAFPPPTLVRHLVAFMAAVSRAGRAQGTRVRVPSSSLGESCCFEARPRCIPAAGAARAARAAARRGGGCGARPGRSARAAAIAAAAAAGEGAALGGAASDSDDIQDWWPGGIPVREPKKNRKKA